MDQDGKRNIAPARRVEWDGFRALTGSLDSFEANWGLRSAFADLRPGGMLGIWSAYRDDAFRCRLETAGFLLDEVAFDAYGESEGHIIWLARKPTDAGGLDL